MLILPSTALSAMFDSQNQPSVDSYIPQRVLTSSVSLRQRSDRPPWCKYCCTFTCYVFHKLLVYPDVCVFLHTDSSGPSSTVSSAGPSSPTTADTSPRFSFSEKITLTPQSSEEIHPALHNASQCVSSTSAHSLHYEETNPSVPSPILERPSDIPVDSTDSAGQCLTQSPCRGEDEEAPEESSPPCSSLAESPPMESFCGLPGSLPVLLELRESSSEAGSSAQTPLTPEEPDEFFDTQETVEVWGPGALPHPGTPLEVGAPHVPEP